MMKASDERFHELVGEAFERLPEVHREAVKNVAIVVEDEPTPEQREAWLNQPGAAARLLEEGTQEIVYEPAS